MAALQLFLLIIRNNKRSKTNKCDCRSNSHVHTAKGSLLFFRFLWISSMGKQLYKPDFYFLVFHA